MKKVRVVIYGYRSFFVIFILELEFFQYEDLLGLRH